MSKIGIIFGTDTGTTRLIAKKMAKRLGDAAAKPININRIGLDELLQYDFLILGTPTYGHGQLPGKDTNIANGSWADFLPELEKADLSGKVVALYGLGNQEKYGERFADSLFYLYEAVKKQGATIIGSWSTEGYRYEFSRAEVDGRFVGLVIDNNNQGMLTEQRIDDWLKLITPELTAQLAATA
jgi:flavodoxin I